MYVSVVNPLNVMYVSVIIVYVRHIYMYVRHIYMYVRICICILLNVLLTFCSIVFAVR